jgi:serine/threonine protein kinase
MMMLDSDRHHRTDRRERSMSAFTIGKFQVIGPLGEGAHSRILQVRRAADSKHYALKVVPVDDDEDQKFLDQAEHEFKVAQMLDHPNLIKIYALEIQKDWLFRVKKVHVLIEYVNGKTLDEVPRINLPRQVQIFERIAAGLVHMHRRQVCHADLKPNNVMLSRTGEVKIIDYGLAWIKGQGKNRIQGTPEYMAPETARNKMVNERSDIYNLGALMYRLVTWRLPPPTISFEEGGGPVDAEVWERLFKPVTDFAPNTPPALCDLIHRCLSFKALGRPERASEVQGALDHLAEKLVRTEDDRLETIEF